MSIARAFTMRHRRKNSPPSSPKSDSSSPSSPKEGAVAVSRRQTVVDRTKISKPLELISTTNMLSYNAPDVAVIRKLRHPSSTSSSSSSSHGSEEGSSHARSSTDLTDASSLEESPSPITPEPNHLSCFFAAARKEEGSKNQTLAPSQEVRRSRSVGSFDYKSFANSDAPAIPQRAPSHSKSAHVRLARKRSLQSLSSDHSGGAAAIQVSAATRSMYSTTTSGTLDRVSRSSSFRGQRTSADFFRADVEPNHPFGKELEQLSEVAEELGGTMRDAEAQDDEVAMLEHGLLKWSADEYLSELIPLYTDQHFSSETTPTWI